VSQTSVTSDFEESFDVLSEFGLEDVRSHLEILSFPVVSLSVEEPSGNTVTFGVIDDASN
jgi:hypothetical protein